MKILKKMKTKTKHGLTLIEALLFLGIAAIVIVGAVVLYNNASNSQRTNDALAQIQSYSTGIKGLYSSVSNYGNSSLTPTIINGGIAPSNAVNGNALVNPWGHATELLGAGSTFQIIFQDVPQDSCTRLLSSGLLSEGGVINVWTTPGGSLPASAVSNPPVGVRGFSATNPPTPAQAAIACQDPNNNVYLAVR